MLDPAPPPVPSIASEQLRTFFRGDGCSVRKCRRCRAILKSIWADGPKERREAGFTGWWWPMHSTFPSKAWAVM